MSDIRTLGEARGERITVRVQECVDFHRDQVELVVTLPAATARADHGGDAEYELGKQVAGHVVEFQQEQIDKLMGALTLAQNSRDRNRALVKSQSRVIEELTSRARVHETEQRSQQETIDELRGQIRDWEAAYARSVDNFNEATRQLEGLRRRVADQDKTLAAIQSVASNSGDSFSSERLDEIGKLLDLNAPPSPPAEQG